MRLHSSVLFCLLAFACADPAADTPAIGAAPSEAEAEPQMPADETAPSFPAGALLIAEAPGRLDSAARAVTLRWPEAAEDEVGVTAYVIRQDGEEVARVEAPASEARLEGVTFEAARTFALVAVDEAGNESSPLETGDALAPSFPEGAHVAAEAVSNGHAITWPEASDDVEVTGYSIQRGEEELASLPATARRYVMRESEERTAVHVVAMDAAGHKTRMPVPALRAMMNQARVEQMLLGALGSGSALHDVLAGGAVTGDAADVLADAEGISVASSGGSLRERSMGGGTGHASGLGGLRAAGSSGPPRVRASARVSGPIEESGPGRFDAAVVTRMLRARSAAMSYCHQRELSDEPSLAGVVRIGFDIAEAGTVRSATVVSNTSGSDALAMCVTRIVRRFRFSQGPEGGSVRYVYDVTFRAQP